MNKRHPTRRVRTERTEGTDEKKDTNVDHDAEFPRNKGSEHQSGGVSEDTHEVPPLATCVNTLPEAVELSIATGLDENCLFQIRSRPSGV